MMTSPCNLMLVNVFQSYQLEYEKQSALLHRQYLLLWYQLVPKAILLVFIVLSFYKKRFS